MGAIAQTEARGTVVGIPPEVPRVRPAVVAPAFVRSVHPIALPRPVQADGRHHSLAALARV